MMNVDFLLNRGFIIFPCGQNGKKPITEHGFKDATKDREIINGWFTKNPDANVAIPTGKVNGITVLDVDKKYGGFYSLEKFDVPETPYVITGGGGRHYYFKYTAKAQTGSNRVGPGLDIRNDGGYVITPPSVHTSGKQYIWHDDHLPFADAPEWLWKNDFEKESKNFDITTWPIPKGRQDDTLFRLTCSLRYKKCEPGVIYDLLKAIINDPQKCPQDKENPFTDKDIERWIKGAFKHEDMQEHTKPEAVIFLNPIDCITFKKKNVPKVEYHTDGILQKKGRTMISAKNNMGKSFFLINLLASICSGEEKFLGNFVNDISKPKSLYLDFEMGESALQERLLAMGPITDLDNLFVQSLYGWNMLDKLYQLALEEIVVARGIEILAFDPLGSMWFGDENKREAVKQMTDYLDYIMDKHNTSIILTHHWRKASRDFKYGGEMAAGSYGWGKWLDNHITLQGEINSLVLSSEKNRNQKKWDQIRIKLNEDTLLYEFLGEFKNTKKFTDDDLLGIFNSFGTERVSRPDILERSAKVFSKSTLDRLISESKYIGIDKSKRTHFYYRKDDPGSISGGKDFIDNPDEEHIEWEEEYHENRKNKTENQMLE